MKIYVIPRWNGFYAFSEDGRKITFEEVKLNEERSQGDMLLQLSRRMEEEYQDANVVPVGTAEWVQFVKSLNFNFPSGIGRHTITIKRAEKKLRDSMSPDMHVVQAVRSITDMNSSLNLISERIREWYGTYYPESLVMEDEKLMPALADDSLRENIHDASGGTIIPPDISNGSSLASEVDLRAISSLAQLWVQISKARDTLENYVRSRSEEMFPNMCALVGPVISSRLVSEAGSLERLCRLPSSTLQLLGAEKALFRHLKTGTPPPKHGILFQHPDLHSAPLWQRGKIARAMAGKVSIAAKLDNGSGTLHRELKEKLTERIEAIRAMPEPQEKPKPISSPASSRKRRMDGGKRRVYGNKKRSKDQRKQKH